MRRVFYSLLAMSFLSTMIGCAHIAGVCDCYPDHDPCWYGPGGPFSNLGGNGSGGCAGCNGGGCAGGQQQNSAPVVADTLPAPARKL